MTLAAQRAIAENLCLGDINVFRASRKKRPRLMLEFPLGADSRGPGVSRVTALIAAYRYERRQLREYVHERAEEYERAVQAGPWC